jgi:uncharacterized protein (TIGR03083 family)
MAVIPLDRPAARAALDDAVRRIVALIRDVNDIRTQVVGTDWTVAETAAHLVVVFTAFADAVTGQPPRLPDRPSDGLDFHTRLATSNAATLAMVDRADPRQLAETIEKGAERFLDGLINIDPGAECATSWYGPGVTRTPDTLTALALGEVTVHGYDIARATAMPWPIPRKHAQIVLGKVLPEMMPLMVDTVATARRAVSFEIRVRGGGPRFVVLVNKGTVRVSAVARTVPVDCVISVAPVPFLLFGYGRIPLWGPILRGQIFSWGTKPWAALRFKSYFLNP